MVIKRKLSNGIDFFNTVGVTHDSLYGVKFLALKIKDYSIYDFNSWGRLPIIAIQPSQNWNKFIENILSSTYTVQYIFWKSHRSRTVISVVFLLFCLRCRVKIKLLRKYSFFFQIPCCFGLRAREKYCVIKIKNKRNTFQIKYLDYRYVFSFFILFSSGKFVRRNWTDFVVITTTIA